MERVEIGKLYANLICGIHYNQTVIFCCCCDCTGGYAWEAVFPSFFSEIQLSGLNTFLLFLLFANFYFNKTKVVFPLLLLSYSKKIKECGMWV
jgi:hypothetical protein